MSLTNQWSTGGWKAQTSAQCGLPFLLQLPASQRQARRSTLKYEQKCSSGFMTAEGQQHWSMNSELHICQTQANSQTQTHFICPDSPLQHNPAPTSRNHILRCLSFCFTPEHPVLQSARLRQQNSCIKAIKPSGTLFTQITETSG